jgi:ABC-type transporter Mla MlaB component
MDQAGRVQVLLDPARGLAIDLSRLGDLDPAGLQLLLSLRISCSARNQPFQVTGLAAELGDRLLALGVKDFVPGSNP